MCGIAIFLLACDVEEKAAKKAVRASPSSWRCCEECAEKVAEKEESGRRSRKKKKRRGLIVAVADAGGRRVSNSNAIDSCWTAK